MAKKRSATSHKIVNRRATYDYSLEDSFVVGLQLTGAEAKALRRGQGSLRGAYVTVKSSAKGGELWLINATISSTPGIIISESDQTRSRKLLAKHREIQQLMAAKQQGRTIVPIELLTRGRYIKLKIAAGKGKKHYDKRQTIKSRDEQRKINSAVKTFK